MNTQKLNALKRASGLTNAKIAEITGITLSNIDKITSGNNTNPKLDTIQAICKAIGCTVNDLNDIPTNLISTNYNSTKLNEFVNQKRKELNMGVDELVKKSGIPKGTLSKITAGINTNPTLSTAEALCKALNCSLNDIVGNVQVESFSFGEKNIIKKYLQLDAHGKDIIDTILDKEYERCREQSEKVRKYHSR